MTRTPALVAAAAALGLVLGLGIEARASVLTGDVAPHTVAMAWIPPGASPAGLELDERWGPPAKDRVTRLPSMRARVSEEAAAERRARAHVHRKSFAKREACPREQAAAAAAALDLHRS
jgi:hypothetical protein